VNPVERHLQQLVERLRKAYPESLVSVILYGSAAGGDHHARFSDLNIFCVLRQVTPAELAVSESVFRWWRSLDNPAPLLMSQEEVGRSTDCFPMEFHDMSERRRVLFGTDVIEAIQIDDRFYRAQVEHELRAKLLRLRQKAAGVLSDNDLLLRLMADSVSTFFILARHALRLAGAQAPWPRREILDRLLESLGVEPRPFATLLDLREDKIKPRSVKPTELFAEYLVQIQALIGAVDRLHQFPRGDS